MARVSKTFPFAVLVSTSIARESGGGVVDLTYADCGGGKLIAKLVDVEPKAVKLGQQSPLTLKLKFNEPFEAGEFRFNMSVLDYPVEKKEADFCSENDIELPIKSGHFQYHGNTCPLVAGEQTMDFDVYLNENIPTLLDRLTIDIDMHTASGDRALCANIQTSELSCSHFFGDMSGYITIADPDVGLTPESQKYCDEYNQKSPCTFVHYSGHGSHCEVPAPPDGCHHYVKVTYTEECANALADAKDWSGKIDFGFRFGHDGILTDCADFVTSVEDYCWGPPADAPVQCACPDTNTLV